MGINIASPGSSAAALKLALADLFDITHASGHGAVGDGVADDTAELQAAIDAAGDAGGGLVVLARSYKITGLTMRANVKLAGLGPGVTRLVMPSGTADDAIYGENLAGVEICDLGIDGPGNINGAVFYACIRLVGCSRPLIHNVDALDGDAAGIALIDCVDATVRRCIARCSDARYNDGAGTAIGFGFWIDSCVRPRVHDCLGYQTMQPFALLGDDTDLGNINDHKGTLPRSETIGAIVSNCHAVRMTQHAFNANTLSGTLFANCIAQEYNGSASPRPAFQTKTSGGDADNMVTKFVGCIAIDCDAGIMVQEGSGSQIIGFQGWNLTTYGALVNSCPGVQIRDLMLDGFTTYGVWIISSSGVTVNGVMTKATDAVASLSVKMESAGSCTLDNIVQRNTHFGGLDIDSGTSGTVIGPGVRLPSVVDASTTTVYPFQYSKTVPVSGGSKLHGLGYPHRAMTIGRVDLVTMVAVTGTTPTIGVGETGSASKFISGQNPNASAGNVVSFAGASLLSRALGNGKAIEATTNGAATTGEVLVSVHGLLAA